MECMNSQAIKPCIVNYFIYFPQYLQCVVNIQHVGLMNVPRYFKVVLNPINSLHIFHVILRRALNPRMRDLTHPFILTQQYPRGEIVFIMCYVSVT